ncbi:hypothetical protein [Microbacterium sp. NPDC058389]|uniref:hypothetical protein n=1 Tax=Microbacterium sp. NPDC058389 TaxID=3346475 RepID=UPI003661FD90
MTMPTLNLGRTDVPSTPESSPVEGPAARFVRTAEYRQVTGVEGLARIESEALSTVPELAPLIDDVSRGLDRSLAEVDARLRVPGTRDELADVVGPRPPRGARMLSGTLGFVMLITAIFGGTIYLARRPFDLDVMLHLSGVLLTVSAVCALLLVLLSLISVRRAWILTPFLVVTAITAIVGGGLATALSTTDQVAYDPEAQFDARVIGIAALVIVVACSILFVRIRAERKAVAERASHLQPRLREIETALLELRTRVLAELTALPSDERSQAAQADRNAALELLEKKRHMIKPARRVALQQLPLGALHLLPAHDDLIGANVAMTPQYS